MLQILFAFLAGILTIAAPCILPMLPIILGASVGHTSSKRPLFIVLGFVLSFAAASLVLSLIVTHLGLSQNTIRDVAIVVLLIFAVFMIWPTPFEILTTKLSGAINKANEIGTSQSGNRGGFLLGLVLGIVWTPCAGPVLGTILTLIATQGTTGRASILVLSYALGAGIPMMIVAYGSQYITTKVRSIAQYSKQLQQVFGVLILLLAIAMYFQYDVQIENKLTTFFPQSNLESALVGQNMQNGNPPANQTPLNPMPIITTGQDNQQTANNTPAPQPKINMDLKNYGKAPEFSGISNWLNSDPLTMTSLKGKVILIDFWTYSCINCIRTLPYVTKWYDTYKDKGFVVIGVHTPEFAFEKVSGNVQTAMGRFGIHYPVAQDNDYGTWNAYNNQYWPAEYLIDQKGNIVYEHFGEGEYDHTENAIRELLSYNTEVAPENGQDLSGIGSPEMYFEPSRLEFLSKDQHPSLQPTNYQLPTNLGLNSFALAGTWQFADDHAVLITGPGKIRLHYRSKNVYMVASSDKPTTITIRLDGDKTSEVTVQASQLYDIVKSDVSGDHTIDIEIPDAGFQAFTFTFG